MNKTEKSPCFRVPNAAWDKYKDIISRFMNQDAARQTIIWARHVNQMLSHGEDYIPKFFNVEIEGLCNFNYFRSWPINVETVTGELDEENLSVLISRDYLQEHGYLDKNGYWKLNWSQDRFVIEGQIYKPFGDSNIAQAKDESVCFMVILRRDKEIKKLEFIEDGKSPNT